VTKVKELCLFNWHKYIADNLDKTPGQLLPYPMNVLPDGTIEVLEGVKSFPGNVLSRTKTCCFFLL